MLKECSLCDGTGICWEQHTYWGAKVIEKIRVECPRCDGKGFHNDSPFLKEDKLFKTQQTLNNFI